MAYTGGTVAARECIAKLTKLGALVDVYSKTWLSTHPDFPHFSSEDLVDYQLKSNGACVGHLLVISTSLDLPAVSTLLPAAHPGFAAYFAEEVRNHRPDLIFINLASLQILCVGLGRKNQLFGYAIGSDDVDLRDGTVHDVIYPWRKDVEVTPTVLFMREFLKYDYADIVPSLIESLYEFGVCARAWDHLPLNPDQIEEILEQGPNEDGLYNIDDEMMSLDEARNVISEFEEVDECGRENLSYIQDLFPELTWGDLSTGDY